jgi:hypothetical protein
LNLELSQDIPPCDLANQGEEETWDTVGASERSISLAPTTRVTVPGAAQQAAGTSDSQALAEERSPDPSLTTRAEQPEGACVEDEATREAGIVDITSILGARTVTVVRLSL